MPAASVPTDLPKNSLSTRSENVGNVRQSGLSSPSGVGLLFGTASLVRQSQLTPSRFLHNQRYVTAYFQRGLKAYPELCFRLEDVLWGINSIVLYYTNQEGTRTGEFMELSASGKVARVVANYSS